MDNFIKGIILIILGVCIGPLSLYGQFNVTATYYHAGPKHKLSWYTANGDKIDVKKLNSGKLRWVALSHDLLKHYKYGDTITVISNNLKLNGKWVVKDKMHSKWKMRIDFLSKEEDNLGMLKPLKVRIK